MFSVYADDKLFYSPRLLDERYAITEPQATLELNKAGSFTFNLPSINPMYSSLKKLKTIITIREDDEVLWKGRVLNDAKDFYNTKAVTCEGELAFLNDIQYEPHDYSKKGIKMGEYFKKLIEHYASECSEERMIKLGNVRGAFTDVLIYPKTTDYTNVWNLISGNLIGASTGKVGKDEVDLSDYDRYLYIRREKGVSYIDFVDDIGKASSQIIEFGKNLLDLSEYVDASNVYTQIIPLGKADSKGNRVNIKLVNGGKNYLQSDSAIALFGKIQKSVIWEDVTNRNTLKANGQRMLNKAVEMAIKITIRAFDLHRINVNTDKIDFGDKVHVVSLPHEISSDFLCSKIVFTLDNLENTEYTFGLDFETMSGSFASYKRTYQYKMESALEIGNQNTQGLLDAMTRMDSLQTQVDGSICSWFIPVFLQQKTIQLLSGQRLKQSMLTSVTCTMTSQRVLDTAGQRIVGVTIGMLSKTSKFSKLCKMPHGHSLLRMEKCVASAPSRTLRMRLVTFGYKVVAVIFCAVSTIVKAAVMWQVIG